MIEPRGIVCGTTIPTIEILGWNPLIIHIEGLGTPITMRFYSPDDLGFIIDEFICYRKVAWPDAESLNVESSRWIPVDARLPSAEQGWVQICVEYPRGARQNRDIWQAYYEPVDGLWRTKYSRLGREVRVTHWMPLPGLPTNTPGTGGPK